MFQLARANQQFRGRIAIGGAVGALALALLPAAWASEPRVVGGVVADPGEWPAAVALFREDSKQGFQQFCGGTLIAPQHVLTARHCVTGPLDPTLTAIIGRYDLSETDGEEIAVTAVHRAPRADLAVLELSLASTYAPFPLATRAQDRVATAPGEVMRVAGWGDTRPRRTSPSEVLLEVRQFGKPAKRCKRAYPFFKTAKSICALGRRLAARQHGSSCYGDSGGPLVADVPERVLVGAVEGGGRRCGDPRNPPYYTRVATSRRWIRDQLP